MNGLFAQPEASLCTHPCVLQQPDRQGAPLALPDKPSIAVLPFQNLSGDPEQEYFTDGMVEEIITALARIRWLFVIAASSSFAYKGQAVDVRRIGRELGVRYLLEGSVRTAGGQVRITAQLIEAATGAHLWDQVGKDKSDHAAEADASVPQHRRQRNVADRADEGDHRDQRADDWSPQRGENGMSGEEEGSPEVM